MIKKTLILLAVIVGVIACNKPVEMFSISGTIEGLDEGEVVYLYDNSIKEDIDSSVSVKGSFSFSGTVDETKFHYLIVRRGEEVSYCGFWIENTDISILGDMTDLSKAKVMGSKMQDQQNEYQMGVEYLAVQFDSLYALYNPNDKELAAKLEVQIDSLMEVETKEKVNFVKANPDYDYAGYLSKRLVRNLSPEEGQELYAALSENQKQSKYGQAAKEFLDLNKNLAIGDSYVDLALPNMDGQTIALSSLEGKYILIDFWASWCGPCRRESPYLRDAYAKFKDKGFEIYAVSIDNDANKWIEAVAEDEMTWTTVLADGAFDSKAAMMYGVKYIPFNYLIDPDGKIIEMHLRGEALIEKLGELLAE